MSDDKKPDFNPETPDFKQTITEKKDVISNSDLPTLRPLEPKDKENLVKMLKERRK